MRWQHVGTEVAGQDDAALALGNRRIEVFPAADAEHSLGPLIGHAVKEHVAGPPENLVAGQLLADRGNIPVAIERLPRLADGLLERLAQVLVQPVLELTESRKQPRRRRQRQPADERQDPFEKPLADVLTASLHRPSPIPGVD